MIIKRIKAPRVNIINRTNGYSKCKGYNQADSEDKEGDIGNGKGKGQKI